MQLEGLLTTLKKAEESTPRFSEEDMENLADAITERIVDEFDEIVEECSLEFEHGNRVRAYDYVADSESIKHKALQEIQEWVKANDLEKEEMQSP